jgi:hypothetical protein
MGKRLGGRQKGIKNKTTIVQFADPLIQVNASRPKPMPYRVAYAAAQQELGILD